MVPNMIEIVVERKNTEKKPYEEKEPCEEKELCEEKNVVK